MRKYAIFRFQIEPFRKTVIFCVKNSVFIHLRGNICFVASIFTFCFKSSDPSEYSSVESDESYSFDFGVFRTSFDLPRFDLGSDFVLRERVA